MDSSDYPPSPNQLLCPKIRIQISRSRMVDLGGTNNYTIENSYYICDAREDIKASYFHHLDLLPWCNNKEGQQNDFACKACGQFTIGTIYYYCKGCAIIDYTNNCYYHKECVESPTVFISPYHPRFRLQLLRFEIMTLTTREYRYCHFCGEMITKGLVYYSSICHLIFHLVCTRKRELLTIKNPKIHEHTLHYFPRKASITCNVCGSNDNKFCFYICHQCDFVVHITCVDLPRIIQISRHRHRLFFTSSLPSGVWSCGVCRQMLDGDFGEYSCSKGCAYAVHCRCATASDVWDGKELEDQPENVYDNINSYEEIGDGIIRHFSHPHHTMIFDTSKEYNENKLCEACILPLYDGYICRCMQCDFVLHEACANLPRVIYSMVHAHPFILQPGDSESYFSCKSCSRLLSGFRYKCCEGCDISLDVRCASLSEPVHHQSHPHPLFLIYTRIYMEKCLMCGELFSILLNCVSCKFTLCFCCATLPRKVKHKDDDHFLTISYENDAICLCWCQVCENKIYPKTGYYSCSDCGTTFHVQCILGRDPYMKPGKIIEACGLEIDIIPNNRLIRPICDFCKRRCQYKLVFKNDGKIFCSNSELPRIFLF